MLTVHVILHDAVTHKTSEIARMTIGNDRTGRHERGNYVAKTFKMNEEGKFFSDNEVLDQGFIRHYARTSLPVWYLIMCALHACGYRIPVDTNFARPLPHKK